MPVAPLGGRKCAPADAVRVVVADGRADGECVLPPDRAAGARRLMPLVPERAALYGIVPDGVTGARVTILGATAEVDARERRAPRAPACRRRSAPQRSSTTRFDDPFEQLRSK